MLTLECEWFERFWFELRKMVRTMVTCLSLGNEYGWGEGWFEPKNRLNQKETI